MFALILPFGGYSQVAVTSANGQNVEDLLNEHFLGGGVVISNARFNGQAVINSNAIGTFTNETTEAPNVGSSAGIVMVTGDCMDASAGQSLGTVSTNASPASDGDGVSPALALTLRGQGNTQDMNDVAVLQFDFIPSGDRSLSALVGIADMENLNKIPFNWNPDNKPEIRVIANGLGMRAVVEEQARYCFISIDAAMRLLQAGNLGINSFKNRAKAFDEDGEVLPNQRLQLKEVKLGQYVLDRIEMVTAEEMPAEIILNRSAMSQLGRYSIDKEKKHIVVEE